MAIWKAYERHMISICILKPSGIFRRVARADLLTVVTALALGSLGTVASAQSPTPPGTFTPPPGCTGWLTVQSRGCRVSNHYKCAADAPGDQWRADFDQEGIFFVSRIDRETQWIESYDMFPTVRQTLDPDAADPASFSGLLATGLDTFDFGLTEDTGAQTTVQGFDKLTGTGATIDGIALQQTEFDYTETGSDGSVIRKAHGHEYINPEWRLFFSGTSVWQTEGKDLPVDGTPKEFIFPGEKGFFSTAPVFDCDVVTSETEGHAVVPVGERK